MEVVGRFGAPYGVKGWIKVVSFTVPATNLLEYRPWHVQDDDDWRPLEITSTRVHQQGFVVRIDGFEDRSAVESLKGRDIGVPEEALPLPATDEFYWKDLIGLAVVTEEGDALGRVVRLMETGAHDVLVVEGNGTQLLIPFVAPVVTSVDVDAGTIVAEWRADY